jgi:hypothetical protein
MGSNNKSDNQMPTTSSKVEIHHDKEDIQTSAISEKYSLRVFLVKYSSSLNKEYIF